MIVELRFSAGLGPQPGGAVVLRFGALGDAPIIAPPTSLRMSISAPWRRAARGPSAAQVAPWRAAQGVGAATNRTRWSVGTILPRAYGLPWLVSAPIQGWGDSPWVVTVPIQRALVAPWRFPLLLRAWGASPFSQGTPAQIIRLASWRGGLPVSPITRTRWAAPRFSAAATVLGFDGGLASTWAPKAPWQSAIPVVGYGAPWTPPAIPVVPVVPCYQPDPGNAVALLFREALTGLAALVFACRKAALALVPIRRVYMVTNVTTLIRVSDGAAIPCLGFSLSLDVDSWAWGFSASIKADALSMVEPGVAGEPVELQASVNGTQFRLIAESLSRERTFGQASVRIQGRGKTAVLAAPYSALATFSAGSTLTSQQLLDQALPIGWTANWGLTAWSVPGGNWSHQGTPATAAVAIAAAGGGYVQPHASLNQISVLPRYPVAPWAWGGVTPDLELPAAVTAREGIEWIELPRYNGVYVSGATSAGVLNLVKRTGTAGDVLAQMISDPLNTHVDASRQRGLPVLARTGRWADVTLRLPVLPETNVIRPGQFVRYVDGATTRLGLVRAVSVDVAMPEVWQTIKVETYVG